jgi:hypothetical protein
LVASSSFKNGKSASGSGSARNSHNGPHPF